MANERGQGKQKPAKKKVNSPSGAAVPLREVASAHKKPVTALAFAPDGQTFVSGSDDTTVRLWDATTGEACPAGVMSEAPWGITDIVFSPTGRTVAVVSRGVNQPVAGQTRAFLWDLIKRRNVELQAGSALALRCPTFAPDGQAALLAAGIRLFDTAGRQTAVLPQGDKGDRIACSPDGAWIVFGNWQGPLHVLDIMKRTEVGRLEGHTDSITGLAFSPDGRWLASSSSSHGQTWEPREEDRSVRLWDFHERKQTRSWAKGWETTASLAFLADNRHLLSFHEPHGKAELHLWAIDAVESLASWSPQGGTTAVAVWSSATAGPSISGLIVTGHEDGAIRLWDIADVLPAPGIGPVPAPTPTVSPAPAGEQSASPRTKKTQTTRPAGDEYDEFFPS